MIKPQQFIALAVATALSLLMTLGLYVASNRWSSGKVEGAPLLPSLDRQLGSLGAIEVTQGGRQLTIAKAGKVWGLKERGGFPVKADAVRALLVTLAEAQLVEPRTALADKLVLLELDDPAQKDSKARGVRLLDTSGKALGDVVIGKTRWDAFGAGRGGVYVRQANATQSWLASGDPKVTADIKDWIDTKVFGAEVAKVRRLTVEHPGEEALVIERAPPAPAPAKDPPKDAKTPPAPAAKENKFQLAKMPDGKKLKKDANIDQIVDALGSIDLDDVRKLEQTPTGDKVSIFKLEQEGGVTTTLRLRKDGDATWLSLEEVGEGDAKKQADVINGRAKGWEFKLPTWKADQLMKRRADLFETS